MEMISVLLLAVAISIDGFVAGLAYGIRRVRVPLLSVIIVSITSGVAVLSAMWLGSLLGTWLGEVTAERLGAGLLVGLGLWTIGQSWQEAGHSSVKESYWKSWKSPVVRRDLPLPASDTVIHIRLQPFGLVIQILREPLSADLDSSGVVSGWEALLLGTALALDAVGIGMGASLAGFPAVATCLSVAGVKFLLLTGGLMAGHYWVEHREGGQRIWTYLPGLILIALGVWWLL